MHRLQGTTKRGAGAGGWGALRRSGRVDGALTAELTAVKGRATSSGRLPWKRQLSFGARGCRGVSGPVLSPFMLRVSRAVVVACTICGEGEGTRTRACRMFNDAPVVQERLRPGHGDRFRLWRCGTQVLKHSARLGLTTVDAA